MCVCVSVMEMEMGTSRTEGWDGSGRSSCTSLEWGSRGGGQGTMVDDEPDICFHKR